jgi:hypothetical protein
MVAKKSVGVRIQVQLEEDYERELFRNVLEIYVPNIVAAKLSLWQPTDVMFGGVNKSYRCSDDLETATAIILDFGGEVPADICTAVAAIRSTLRSELLCIIRRGKIGIYLAGERCPVQFPGGELATL